MFDLGARARVVRVATLRSEHAGPASSFLNTVAHVDKMKHHKFNSKCAIKYMDKEEMAVLRILDGLRKWKEWVYVDDIKSRAPYGSDVIEKAIGTLHELGMIQRRKEGEKVSIRITNYGLDMLAIKGMSKWIGEIGNRITRGKEARIIRAWDKEGNDIAIKLHKYWKTEFRRIKESLAYAAVVYRGRELDLEEYEIDIPKAKAQIEFKALQKLEGKINVPKPIDMNRHAVLMEMVSYNGEPAPSLDKIDLKNPEDGLDEAMRQYCEALDLGIIHGDFSQFNILLSDEGEIYIIDWPQAVPVTYEHAKELVKRDVINVQKYFQKKYGVRKDYLYDCMKYLRG